jgi:radical SAM superfamily enzyme YgiQ (UPF0313 family)
MKELIYYADLRHTGTIANADCFPLGIGCVAAYAETQFPDAIESEVFVFPDDLSEALSRRTPRLLCLSNYTWNLNLQLAFANSVKQHHPEVVVVMGGPNISVSPEGRKEFLQKNSAVDFYIKWDGEYAFSHLNRILIDNDYDAKAVQASKMTLANCLYLADDELVEGMDDRISDLMTIPSPYTSGLFDKFFEQGLRPLVEFTRGCPYGCTFCNDSAIMRNKVYRKSSEFISDELEYIASHMKFASDLFLCDLNFGMFTEDLETARIMRSIIDRYDWPNSIECSPGKSHPDRILEAVSIINGNKGIIKFGASMQSTDPVVLANIKRKNIPMEKVLPLREAKAELGTDHTEYFTELILALPEDTKERHFQSLRDTIDVMGMNFVNVHQLTLLQGTPMALDHDREKYGFDTRYRVFVGCIGTYKIAGVDKAVAEIEEVVVGSNTMTFDDWLECRVMDILVKIYIDWDNYLEVFGMVRRLGLSSFDLLLHLRDNYIAKDSKFGKILEQYVQKSQEPLHSDWEEITQFTSRLDVVEKFANGELGGNELTLHRALAYRDCYEELHTMLRDATLSYLEKRGRLDEEVAEYVNQAVLFSQHRKFNFDNFETNLEGTFSFDFLVAETRNFKVLPDEVKIEPSKMQFYLGSSAQKEIDYALKQWVVQDGNRDTIEDGNGEHDGHQQGRSDTKLANEAQLKYNLGKLFNLSNWKVYNRTAEFVE